MIPITLQQIQERKSKMVAAKAQIEATIKQLNANLQATDGAIQDCDHWISEMAKEEVAKGKPEKKS